MSKEEVDWTFDFIEEYNKKISKIADGYNLDYYSNQIEIITAEQMMDAYSSVGMPVNYAHWSFGKSFLNIEKEYKRGNMGLAYELVINSDPCISYLMEENSIAMQILVIAHACFGHNSFFKSNYLFQAWTSADSIVDYFIFAKNYISVCEEKYGTEKVEEIIDACHALMNYGVDRYKHPIKLSMQEEKLRQKSRAEYLQSQINELWRTIPKKNKNDKKQIEKFPKDSEENIFYFLEKNSPILESWEREIVRIIGKIAQYFYPQRHTKVMNEGWATFWHYTILHDLHKQGDIDDKVMLEFLHSHTNVIFQPEFDSHNYSGINPYTLGFSIFKDIRRICEHPTEEDKKWFPNLVNTNWVESLDFAMRNFKDESFISQYLSPKVIRDLKLFTIIDDEQRMDLEVTKIHDEDGYLEIRKLLSEQYNISYIDPNIQIYSVDLKGDREMLLQHIMYNDRPLEDKSTQKVIKYLHRLWGYSIKLDSINSSGNIANTFIFPKPKVDN